MWGKNLINHINQTDRLDMKLNILPLLESPERNMLSPKVWYTSARWLLDPLLWLLKTIETMTQHVAITTDKLKYPYNNPDMIYGPLLMSMAFNVVLCKLFPNPHAQTW
jgi:hypothetical protein